MVDTGPQQPPPTGRVVIEKCAIATVDAEDTEYASGHLVVNGNRIESLGPGDAPEGLADVTRRIDGTGHLLTPGLINTHHHFYQWLTRGLAQDCNLFDWLVTLYPVWARIDEEMVHAAARGSLGMMARGGVTTARWTTITSSRAVRATCWAPSSARPVSSASASPRRGVRWTAASRTAACPRTSPWRPWRAR